MSGSPSHSAAGDHTVRCRRTAMRRVVIADAFANFRPMPSWRGEYGFDWLRDGDYATSEAESISYITEDVAGKHYKPVGAANQHIETDVNGFDGDFRQKPAIYNRLKTEFEHWFIQYSDGTREENFASFLSIYVNENDANDDGSAVEYPLPRTVLIQAQVKKAEGDLIRFEFDFDDTLFAISPLTLPPATGNTDIEITCNEAFRRDELIELMAVYNDESGVEVKKPVGRLIVVANKPRKIKKILLVSVKTPEISPGSGENTGNIDSQNDYIKQSLRQAIIDPLISQEFVDISGADDFDPYIHAEDQPLDGEEGEDDIVVQNFSILTHREDNQPLEEITTYCYRKLQDDLASRGEPPNKYRNYYKTYVIGERIGCINPDGSYSGLDGIQFNSGSGLVVAGDSSYETGAHEILHALHVPHTFTAYEADHYAYYTYRAQTTDNMMDYTGIQGGEFARASVSLYRWQWRIARMNAENE